LDRFSPDLKDPINEFKKNHQTDKVDDYSKSYERVKARVIVSQYSDEEYYLLGFLSGLNDEIFDAILLYNPTTLKQAYKLTRQLEKSIASHNRMIKNVIKTNTHYSFPSRQFKPREDNTLPSSSFPVQPSDQPDAKQLTLDQNKALGLCYKCGEISFSDHKCKMKGLYLLEGDQISDGDHSLDDDFHALPLTTTEEPNTVLITLCAATGHTNHPTLLFQGKIQSLDIIAMIDSGSTYSFINLDNINYLAIPTSAHLISVTTASGVQMSTN
jgi:hypothetical protein